MMMMNLQKKSQVLLCLTVEYQKMCHNVLCSQCMIHTSYTPNHLSCKALDGNVPLGKLDGVSPDISIILLYTFYQPVFYATQNQSYHSVSEEQAAHWVGFGEHVGDTITHISPTSFLMMTPRKSSTDLLLDLRFCPSQQEIGTRWRGELQDLQTHCLCQV